MVTIYRNFLRSKHLYILIGYVFHRTVIWATEKFMMLCHPNHVMKSMFFVHLTSLTSPAQFVEHTFPRIWRVFGSSLCRLPLKFYTKTIFRLLRPYFCFQSLPFFLSPSLFPGFLYHFRSKMSPYLLACLWNKFFIRATTFSSRFCQSESKRAVISYRAHIVDSQITSSKNRPKTRFVFYWENTGKYEDTWNEVNIKTLRTIQLFSQCVCHIFELPKPFKYSQLFAYTQNDMVFRPIAWQFIGSINYRNK